MFVSASLRPSALAALKLFRPVASLPHASFQPSITSMPPGYVGSINTNIPGQVNLVVQFRPPAIGNVVSANGSLIITGTGPTNASFYVLTSTTLLLPRSQWTRIATNQFDAAGSFSFTNLINPLVTNSFFELQLP